MTKMVALSDEVYEKLEEIKVGSFSNTIRRLVKGKSVVEVKFEDIEPDVRKVIREEIEKAKGSY